MKYAGRLAAGLFGPALFPLSLLALSDAAWASCDPAAASGVNAVCSGTTNNQNDPFGFGNGVETNVVSVTVLSGASVTGTEGGIFLGERSTVTNFGSIAAATDGVAFGVTVGPESTVTSSGSITAAGAIHALGVSAGDRSAVTSSGSITATSDSSAFGVLIAGAGTVMNSGGITATGGGLGLGVEVNEAGTVTNSGSIVAKGGGEAIGVFLGDGTVTSSGSIAAVASNGSAIGIELGTGTVTSSGIISATGADAAGVSMRTGTVINAGTISAVASAANGSSTGVGFDGTGTVINSGTITASGSSAFAVAGAATLFNSGRIVAFGAGGIGAQMSGDGAMITNSGIISGAQAAIAFSGANNTLTVLPGSTIVGAINLNGAGDTINFRGGNHNLTFGFNPAPGGGDNGGDNGNGNGNGNLAAKAKLAANQLTAVTTLNGLTVTGTTPFAVSASGNQAAAIDPTPFAMSWRTLTDFARAVWEAVPQIGGSAGAGKGGAPLAFAASDSVDRIDNAFAAFPGLSAYAGDTIAFKAPTVVYGDGSTMWGRGFAGQRSQPQDGVLLHATNQLYGGMIGGDWQMQPGLRVGAFVGGGHTRTDIDFDSHDVGDLAFAGLYARYAIGATLLHAGLQGGGSQNSVSRRVNNNLAPNGIEQATARFNGWYLSPEAVVATHIALGRLEDAAYTLTPSLRVQYLYGAYGGYSETGTTAPLTVGSRIVSTFEERGELKLTRTVTLAPRDVLALSLFGGVQGVQRAGGDTINAALLGQAIPFATPGNPGVWGGYGGTGLEWRSGAVSIYTAAEYLALSDHSHVVSGRGGLRVDF